MQRASEMREWITWVRHRPVWGKQARAPTGKGVRVEAPLDRWGRRT